MMRGSIDWAVALLLSLLLAAWAHAETEVQKLLASDAAAFDQFGTSLAAEGNTAVVGAWFDLHASGSGGASGQGSAYVLVRSGGTWTQQAKLMASDAAASDQFGIRVAVSGDTAVVGANLDDLPGGLTNAGSAYVFTRSGTVWMQQAKLTASDAATDDRLGIAAALNGDTALIGAQFGHAGAVNSGVAYLFVKPPGGWTTMTETAQLTASDATGADQFGYSVALDGDKAIVGARLDDHAGGNDAGTAYVFVKPPGGWTHMTESVIGACCAPWGNCACGVMTAGQCTIAEGNFLGQGTVCPSSPAQCGAICPPGDFDHDSDVDSTDHTHLRACRTRALVTQLNAACLDADLDGDFDVDPDDHGIFQRCYSGRGVPGNPNCQQ